MPKITALSQLDLNKTYSYADYLTWQLGEIVELVKGKISAMEPAPNVSHQRISIRLSGTLYDYFKHKKCELFAAPFDVRLYDRKKSILKNQDIQTVVQPDLCVVCNPEFLDEQGCNGAPDWIIEILSKGNSKREMQVKYELYREAGVTEYWIVHPNDCAIHQFVLNENGRYDLVKMFTDDDVATPHLFPDLAVKLEEIF
ncbi:MAG: Uma2 family endonuclease [Methylococcales bacterium]|nr:Uma2 family endonuclease [Methylococcales bacterium]